MSVNHVRAARRTTLVAIATLAGGAMMLVAAKPWAGAPAMFGGPVISIETPVNPYDASVRGALLLVHTYHHGTKEHMPLTAKAEGLVDGQRRSLDLKLVRSSQAGTHGLHRQWGDKGIWTLLITATPENHGGGSVQAVVDIAADGEVARVRVPRTASNAYRLMTAAEVDRELRERARAPMAVGAR
jgi:hypothetical protein